MGIGTIYLWYRAKPFDIIGNLLCSWFDKCLYSLEIFIFINRGIYILTYLDWLDIFIEKKIFKILRIINIFFYKLVYRFVFRYIKLYKIKKFKTIKINN